jgi:Ca2+-binding EF-hand superfamily protein
MKRFLLLALLFIGFGGSIEAFSENKHSALFRNLDRDQDGLIARKEWIGN